MRREIGIAALLATLAAYACSGGQGSGSTGGTGGTTGADGGTGAAGGADGGTTGGTTGGSSSVTALCTGLGVTVPSLFTTCLKATPAFVATLATDFGKNSCQDVSTAVAKGHARPQSSRDCAGANAVTSSGCTAPKAKLRS